MPFPDGWPPRTASGQKSIRVYLTGSGTANFEDNAFFFAEVVGASPYIPLPVVEPGSSAPVTLDANPMGGGQNDTDAPAPMIFAENILIRATGGAVDFSFDGVNVHGSVPAGEMIVYSNRKEAGIAVKGADYVIEAW